MTTTEKYVLFYGEDWPSNFAPSPICVPDDFRERGMFDDEPVPTIIFKTAEAYFQSRKAVLVGDKVNYYKIAYASSPLQTKKIARKIKLNPDKWNKVRVKYMWETLQLKFDQNPDLKTKLLSPSLKDKKFIEASPTDVFWGAGRSERSLIKEIEECGDIEWFDFGRDLPRAENMLGELLTKLRKTLI